MANRINTYGLKFGQCNICGSHGRLTEDHTPPKACLRPTKIVLKHIGQLLSSEEPREKGRMLQNGVKYRTLCPRCNNTLLGSKYDPAFISFVNQIGKILKNPLYLPNTLQIQAQPQAVMRAVLGHISAQGVDRYLKGPHTESMRDYFLDVTKPLPLGIRIFYWAYPHRPFLLIRDAAYLDITNHQTFGFWLLKFFPVAFLVTWDLPDHLTSVGHSLDKWRNSSFTDFANLPLTLRPLVSARWPEAPSDNHVLLYANEAVFANG